MSHNLIIQAIRIKLDVMVTQHTELGVYTANNASEIRWSENQLTGTTLQWTSGIIAKNGMGTRSQSADFSRGGCPADETSTQVMAINTNQLIFRLKELGIKLTGLPVQIWEFEGTESDNDSVSARVVFTGEISTPTWDETILDLPLTNGRYKRRAELGTIINNNSETGNFTTASDDQNGEMLPITYGKLYGDSAAKLLRVSDIEEIWTNDLTIYYGSLAYNTPRATNAFPVIGVSGSTPYLTYIIQTGSVTGGIGSYIAALDSMISSNYFVGKFIKVIDGGAVDEQFNGQYRRISSVSRVLGSDNLQITIDSFFKKDLSYDATATATNNAWIQIVTVPREYQVDNWPCLGFVDESGNAIAANDYPRLLVYDDAAGLIIVPTYGYSISSVTNKNKISIDLKMFSGSPTDLQTFSIYPCKNVSKLIDDNLNIYYNGSTLEKVLTANNWYSNGVDNPLATESGVLANITDRNDSTGFYQKLVCTTGNNTLIASAYQFSIDTDNIKITYDNYYFGIKYTSLSKTNPDGDGHPEESYFRFGYRRFVGSSHNSSLDNISPTAYIDWPSGYGSGNGIIDCLPDFYYLTRTNPDNNKAFYFQNNISSPGKLINDYTRFNILSITTLDKLKSIYKCHFIHITKMSIPTVFISESIVERTIIELALICSKSYSISKNIFAFFGGRIFNDTWGGRKTASAIIENPIDILEETKRKQNWSEVGDNVDFGKQYSPNALIKTGAGNIGSYDNSILDNVKALRPAFQILDKAQANTESFATAFCKQFFCCTYIDSDGNECVSPITESQNNTITDTITLADIIGDIGSTKEPEVSDVFTCPQVNYEYNYGSKKYNKNLIVLNTNRDIPDWTSTSLNISEYFQGFASVEDGKNIWLECNALWKKFRHIEPNPSDLTDCKMLTKYSDAKWYMQTWVSWMGKRRVPLSVPYAIGRYWNVSRHIKIVLPHQTNGYAIECIIEKIKIDKQNNICNLDLILLTDVPTGYYYNLLQNTYENVSDLGSWQNVYKGTLVPSPTLKQNDYAGGS